MVVRLQNKDHANGSYQKQVGRSIIGHVFVSSWKLDGDRAALTGVAVWGAFNNIIIILLYARTLRIQHAIL